MPAVVIERDITDPKDSPLWDDDTMRKVDPSKNYKVHFALGASRKWRNYTAGKWVRDPSRDQERNGRLAAMGWAHRPAEHATIVSGKTALGLMSLHNRWLADNRSGAVAIGSNRSNRVAGQLGVDTKEVESNQTGRKAPLKGDIRHMFLLRSCLTTDEPNEEPIRNRDMQTVLQGVVEATVRASMQSQAKLLEQQSKALETFTTNVTKVLDGLVKAVQSMNKKP